MARQRIQLEITGDSRSVERAFRNANRAGKGFGSTMSKLGRVAAVGVGAAFVGLGLALRRGFREMAEGQKVTAQTRAVLKSTGGVANVSAKHVDRMAASLSRMSGVDDEAIAAGENMLLTFTNVRNGIGKNNKVFDQATKTLLDMSVFFERDMTTMAIQVGKALNDLEVNTKGTITGWSALRRVGVKVTADMMKQGVAFIRAGKPMKAQQLLLRELNTEFGGQARAFGGTFPGAMAKFRNAVDEVAGAFTEGLAPIVKRVATLLTQKMANPAFVARVRELGRLVGEKLYNAFIAISQWFQAHWGGIKNGFRTAAELVRRMHTWVKKIAGITPGGGQTLVGLVLGGILVTKFLAVASALKLINVRLLLMALRFAPVVAGILAVEKFKKDGLFGGGNPRDWKGYIPGKGWLWGKGDGKDKKAPGMKRTGLPGTIGHRASGGRVMPGSSYTVGERGPELLTMGGGGGFVTPNGGGGVTINGNVILPGVKDARGFLRELQRLGNSNTSSRSGVYGGQNLALG